MLLQGRVYQSEKKGSHTHYFRSDLYRALLNKRFIGGVAGVLFAMLFATVDSIELSNSVIYVYWLVIYGVPFMISLIFCASTFAAGICEDYEDRFIYSELIRGDLRKYVFSKTLTIFLTAVLTMILGTLIYVFILRTQLPWVTENEAIYETALNTGAFRQILANGNYIIYYLLCGIQYGILAGILSLIATYVSLYISNRLLVLAVPVMAYYIIINGGGDYLAGLPQFDIYLIFRIDYNLWNHDFYSFMWSLLIGSVLMGAMYVAIYRKVKRRIRDE